jgi:phage gpG-like protein
MPRTVTTLSGNRYEEIARRLPHALREIRQDTAAEIETTIKVGMAASSSPSMPGSMPGVDTGALINSIQVEEDGSDTTVVYTNQEYAPHLEYGTIHMAARPFMTPAAEAARPGWNRRLQTLERRLDE